MKKVLPIFYLIMVTIIGGCDTISYEGAVNPSELYIQPSDLQYTYRTNITYTFKVSGIRIEDVPDDVIVTLGLNSIANPNDDAHLENKYPTSAIINGQSMVLSNRPIGVLNLYSITPLYSEINDKVVFYATVEYTSPNVSGDYYLWAQYIYNGNVYVKDTTIHVQVDLNGDFTTSELTNLWDMGQFHYEWVKAMPKDSPYWKQIWSLYGGTDIHPDRYSHYISRFSEGTIPPALTAISNSMVQFVSLYMRENANASFIFRINDCSLPLGGLFDIGMENTSGTNQTLYLTNGEGDSSTIVYQSGCGHRSFWISPHKTHRRGQNIDVSYYSAYPDSIEPNPTLDLREVNFGEYRLKFNDLLEKYGYEIFMESDHMHIKPVNSDY
jgi:hypothetical protein